MSEWFKTSLGQCLTKMEKQRCAQLIPSEYYARSLQIGFPWINYLEAIEVSSQYIVDTRYPSRPMADSLDDTTRPGTSRQPDSPIKDCHHAVSSASALPFPEKAHDLIVMPHTLDFCANPHEVLRQANQTLVAEGCMVIVGFNLFSFYGGIRVFKNHCGQMPWSGRYYSVGRVQDWLALLGFDLAGAEMISYLPPIQAEKWRKKMAFIEKAGDRWWPGLGGVYIIVGRKREMAVRLLPKTTQTWRNLIPGIAQPASQRAAKIRLKLVPKN